MSEPNATSLRSNEPATQAPRLYVAVIGDLVDSRLLRDRAGVQAKLGAALDELNHRFDGVIASRFLITIGDEFQGLLWPSAALDALWWAYVRLMHMEVETRFGFGVGPLSTPLRPEAIGMDGPCFHAARAAVDRAKAEKRLFSIEVHGAVRASAAVNALGSLLDRVIHDWSQAQWETFSALAELNNQAAVARARGVTRQSVRDTVLSKSGRGPECIAAWRGLGDLLSQIAHGELVGLADLDEDGDGDG